MLKDSTPEAELLNTQINAENDQNNENSSDQLVEKIKIEKTPFHVVGNKDHGYFIAIGRNRVSEKRPTPEEAEELLVTDFWEILANLVVTFNDLMKEHDLRGLKEMDKKV